MHTSHKAPFLRAHLAPLILGSLSTLALTGCYLEDDDKNSGDKDIDAAVSVTLETREDVIQAVATVWNFTGPWAQASAPVREPAPADATSEDGEDVPITVDCGSSGSITYDETASVTTYNDCTETSETTDEASGVSTTETSVIDGVVNEACVLDEGEAEPTDYRCYNAAPLDLDYAVVTTTPAAEGEEEPSTVSSALEIKRDAYLEVDAETETGYRLLISEERSQRVSTEDAEGTQTMGKVEVSTEGFELRMQNQGDAETPAYVFEFNGEAFFENDKANCSDGLLRIGSAEPIAVDPDSGFAPTAGTLVLSTDAVAALAVSFAADRSISFRLNGEDLTATAEELSAACLGSYRVPEEGSETEDPSDDEFCIFGPICF